MYSIENMIYYCNNTDFITGDLVDEYDRSIDNHHLIDILYCLYTTN